MAARFTRRRTLVVLAVFLILGVLAGSVALRANRTAADAPGGRIRIRVLGRDETQAQIFSKLWRSILYKESGSLDILKARRIILASFPDDDYVGQQAYWKNALALEAPGQ